MKKQNFFYIVVLVIGLVGGYLAGWIITKNKMEVEAHDNVVRELSKMSNDLQDAAAVWYAKYAFNLRGEIVEQGSYFRDAADQTLYFVAGFLSNYTDYLIANGKRYTVEVEKELINGKAIPMPSNSEYFIQEIKIDAQLIAENNAEKFDK